MVLALIDYDRKTTFCDFSCDGETLLGRLVCISGSLPHVMSLACKNVSSRYRETLLLHEAHKKLSNPSQLP